MAKKFHALTARQKLIMEQAGFIHKERQEFDENTSTDFHSKYFQRMLKSRRDWRDAMILNGWTQPEIAKRLIHWYRMKKTRSPWDFFRLEYTVIAQKPTMTASRFEAALKLREEMSRQFGRAYGRIRSVKLAQRRGLPGVPRKRRY